MKIGRDHQKRTVSYLTAHRCERRPLCAPTSSLRVVERYAVREKRSERTLPDAVSRGRRELIDTADREFSGISVRDQTESLVRQEAGEIQPAKVRPR